MFTKEEPLSLENIGGGAAMEKFNEELGKVLKDILDPNKDAKSKRSITLTVVFAPDEGRELNLIGCNASSKLAPSKMFVTKAIVGRDKTGKVEAREFDTGQKKMFDEDGKVISMDERRGEQ